LDTVLHSHPNIRGSLLMAAAMAAFTNGKLEDF
jgi:hypothetical protein